MQLQVYIGEIKPNDKVTLSLQPAPDGTTGATKKDAIAKGTEYLDISPEHWLQGQVQSVTNFGLFVRPADHDLVGTSFALWTLANVYLLIGVHFGQYQRWVLSHSL